MKLENHTIPNNIEAERMLISQIILDNNIIYKIVDIQLKPNDFYDNDNKKIYTAIMSLIGENKIVDNLTISNKVGEIEIDILTLAITTEGAEEYAEIIKNNSIKRQIINKTLNLEAIARQNETTIEEIKKRSDDLLNTCISQEQEKEFIEEIDDFLAELYEAPKNKIKTNYKNVDSKLNLSKGQLVTIAGRPGMGKSAVMSCLALSMKNISFFSLEMGKREIAYRMVSSISGIDFAKINNGIVNLEEEKQEKVKNAFEKIKQKKIKVYDKKISFLDIKMELKKLKLISEIEVVFIDYLQLIRGEDTKIPRAMQIGQITRELKSIAKELDILIIIGSQLNRNIENRNGKPKLSDLRESGDIEQDSDIVIFIERDNENEPDKIELQVAKYRNGAICSIELKFDLKTMTLIDKLFFEKKPQNNIDGDELF